MLILAFDTSLDACSVAISYKDNLLAQNFELMHRGHAENLLPMIESVRNQADVSYDQLDLIAVTTGPGTFTGVRVGLAAARGLSLALNVSLLGVSTLEVLATAALFQVVEEHSGIIASIDAKRGQLYLQTFDSLGRSVTIPRIGAIGPHIIPKTTKPGLIVGSGAKFLQSVLPDWGFCEDIQVPNAAYLAVAAEKWEDRISRYPPLPIYLRAPYAELPAGLGVNSKSK